MIASRIRRFRKADLFESLERRVLLTRLVGIDTSEFETVNWTTVHKSIASGGGGKDFAYTRASYGLNSVDAKFTTFAPQMLSAGLYSGFYHYAYYDLAGHTADAEAAHFWSTIAPYMAADGKHLMPVLDVEEGTTVTDPVYNTLSKWVEEWCTKVESLAAAAPYHLYVVPMIYISSSHAATEFDATVPQHIPLWVAEWPTSAIPDAQTASPSGSGVWQTWQFWQYAADPTGGPTGHCPGVGNGTTDPCDLDVLNGDSNMLKDYLVTSTTASPSGRWPGNSWVTPTTSVKAWASSTASGSFTSVAAGTIGQILASPDGFPNPTYGNGFQRWYVHFNNGVNGWVAEDLMATVAPAMASNPNPVNSTTPVSSLPASYSWAGSNTTSYDVYLDGVKQTTVSSASWTHGSIANGTHTWRVDAHNAELSNTGITWSFTFDNVAPTASYGSQTPTPGAATMDFTITYSDATAGLNATTFDSNDVTVTGPGNYVANATFIGATPAGNGSPRTVTYEIPAPGGSWNLSDNGTYTISQNTGQVKDLAGNSAIAGTIATFAAAIPFAWQNGGALTVEYDDSNLPISLGSSGAGITATKDGNTLSFSGVTSIVVVGTSTADVLNWNGPITAPVSLNLGAGGDVLNVNSGMFTFDADASAGTTGLTINVAGAVMFNASQHLAALNLTSGSATLAAGHDKVLVVDTLTATGTGALDLTDNALIANAMLPADFAALLQSGYASGAWNGVGVISSAANQTGNTIGYGQASSLYDSFPAVFVGQSIDDTAMLARYTAPGDSNLDGMVDTADFTLLALNFNSGSQFTQGDFNYDGAVNALDFNTLATTFGTQVPPASSPARQAPAMSLFSAQVVPASGNNAWISLVESTRTHDRTRIEVL